MITHVLEIRRVQEEFDSATPGTVRTIVHPYAMVMTPDCDLEQDFEARRAAEVLEQRLVPRILLCEVQEAGELRRAKSLNARLWKEVRQNQNDRYQFLRNVLAEEEAQGDGLPELAADFKRLLAVPTDELYAQLTNGIVHRRTVLVERYVFNVMQRFYSFQGRVGVPVPHHELVAADQTSRATVASE